MAKPAFEPEKVFRAINWYEQNQHKIPMGVDLVLPHEILHPGSFEILAENIEEYKQAPHKKIIVGDYIFRTIKKLKDFIEPPPISVVKLSEHGDAYPADRATTLGNPFHMRSEGDRDKVCDMFDRYFDLVVKGGDPVEVASAIADKPSTISKAWIRPSWRQFNQEWLRLQMFAARYPTKLGCHCAPKRCHCEKYKAEIEKKRSQ